jgi:tetratricopeptide (TPR) repeat protein
MLKGLAALLLTSTLFSAALVSAEPGATPVPKAGAAKPAATQAASAKPAVAAVKRDPRGIKGISPFSEALKKGDSALVARDFDGAIAAYREAIAKDPQNALGHYRVGEAQLAKGDLHEADEAFLNGLRFVPGTDFALKAKLQFALADLRERQKNYDEATSKWTEYETVTPEQKEAAQSFPATATERKKVIETWKKLAADSADVKARIQKGIAAADEAVRKSSK